MDISECVKKLSVKDNQVQSEVGDVGVLHTHFMPKPLVAVLFTCRGWKNDHCLLVILNSFLACC